MENISETKKIENKKRSLRRYRKNIECLKRLELKISTLEDRISSCNSPSFSGMPRGGVPVTVGDLILDKSDLEARAKKIKLKCHKLKTEITNEIDTLDDTRYIDVLESYFIECKTLEDIAEEKGYSIRHTYKLYSEAIKILALSVE